MCENDSDLSFAVREAVLKMESYLFETERCDADYWPMLAVGLHNRIGGTT